MGRDQIAKKLIVKFPKEGWLMKQTYYQGMVEEGRFIFEYVKQFLVQKIYRLSLENTWKHYEKTSTSIPFIIEFYFYLLPEYEPWLGKYFKWYQVWARFSNSCRF